MFAREAERLGHMARVEPGFRVFFVFPFTLSEDAADQALSMALSARIDSGRAERVSGHRDIIRRLARTPHCHPLLGRGPPTDEPESLGEGRHAACGHVVAPTTTWLDTPTRPIRARPPISGPRRVPVDPGR